MQFANPIWLWALAGLAVPVGIHLLSRKEGKIVPIGSLKHLRESPTAQFRHLRLNEIALLILRCLLLILFVMLLAGIRIDTDAKASKRWLVIEKGIEKIPDVAPLIHRLAEHGFELHSLAPSFPPLSDSLVKENNLDYWALTESLDGQALDSVVVISFNLQKNFKGMRARLPENILWLTRDPEPVDYEASAVPVGRDSLWVRTGRSSPVLTQFETQKIALASSNNTTPVVARGTIGIHVFSDPKFSYDRKIIVAALRAIQSITPHVINITWRSVNEWDDPASDWVIWLSEEPMPWKQKRKSLVYRHCGEGLPLLSQATPVLFPICDVANGEWIITQRLDETTVLRENLTTALADIILPFDAHDRVSQYDRRTQPDLVNWSLHNENTKRSANVKTDDATQLYLILMFITILAGERWLAFKRNQ